MPLLGSIGGGSAKGFGAQANLNYLIRNSLRFRASATAYLTRTVGVTSSNPRSFTWSAWVKRGNLGTNQTFFSMGPNSPSPGETVAFIDTDDKFYFTPPLDVKQIYPYVWYFY